MHLRKRLLSSTFVRMVLLAPLEFITHDSLFRIRVFTVALVVGEPLYFYVWTQLSPQPIESLWLRVTSAVAALPLVFRRTHRVFSKRLIGYYWVGLCFYSLPFAFISLYHMNGYNDVWMGSCVAMIYVLFHMTDWRIALIEILLGMCAVAFLSWTDLVPLPSGSVPFAPLPDLAVLAFAVVTATLFSMSAANLRRERARSALVTMGVLAHEFRTPLTAASMVTECLAAEPDPRGTIGPILQRLNQLHSSMNAQIDYQMGNVRLMDMPTETELLDVGLLTEEAVLSFPLDPRLKACISVDCRRGLYAKVHRDLLQQVIHNLLSNAGNSLMRKRVAPEPSDVQVTASLVKPGVIRIQVSDRGVGIERDRLRRIFEPFESTSPTPTHGLGLTMCKSAIKSFSGKIYCISEIGEGATFVVELPVSSRSRADSGYGVLR